LSKKNTSIIVNFLYVQKCRSLPSSLLQAIKFYFAKPRHGQNGSSGITGSVLYAVLYVELANQASALPRKLTKQYKGTHLDILHCTNFSLP